MYRMIAVDSADRRGFAGIGVLKGELLPYGRQQAGGQ
jgi:hypothetical protein